MAENRHSHNEVMERIAANVEKVIVGKRYCIELMLISLISAGHVLIDDIPGVGKTSLAAGLAKSIRLSFKRVQCTPDILPSDITGFTIYNQKTGEFQYSPGTVMSQLVLVDEINRTPPKTQASLLEVMEEAQVTVDGQTYAVPQPFIVIGTQNPLEYLGTFPLPEAQMDRFFMRISLGYPTPAEEIDIINKYQHSNPLNDLTPVADASDIMEMREQVRLTFIEDSIKSYIVSIVNEARFSKDIALGVSPRGTLALSRAAQAWAFYNNRSYVIPDDVKAMALPVLSHRLILNQEAKLKRVTAQEILSEAIAKVKIPVLEKSK